MKKKKIMISIIVIVVIILAPYIFVETNTIIWGEILKTVINKRT